VPRSHARIERTRAGDYRVRLPDEERRVLKAIPAQLRSVVASNDPVAFRLFPPAYAGEPEHNEEYEHLVHDDLVQERLGNIQVLEETAEAERLSEEQLAAWLSVLNDARLILGTRLDVTEDAFQRDVPENDPQAPALAMYYYLGWLQEQVVEVLAEPLAR